MITNTVAPYPYNTYTALHTANIPKHHAGIYLGLHVSMLIWAPACTLAYPREYVAYDAASTYMESRSPLGNVWKNACNREFLLGWKTCASSMMARQDAGRRAAPHRGGSIHPTDTCGTACQSPRIFEQPTDAHQSVVEPCQPCIQSVNRTQKDAQAQPRQSNAANRVSRGPRQVVPLRSKRDRMESPCNAPSESVGHGRAVCTAGIHHLLPAQRPTRLALAVSIDFCRLSS